MKILTGLLLLPSLVFATGEVPKELELPIQSKLFTKETIVEVAGVKYREVLYKNEKYFLILTGPQAEGDQMKVICEKYPYPMESPALIRVGTQTIERTSMFIEALRVSCASPTPNAVQSQQMILLRPYLAVGFALDTRNDANSYFKKKQILITPGGVGFTAETK